MSLARPIEVRLLGSRVQAVTTDHLVQSISEAVVSRRRLVIGHQNLHSLALLQDNRELRDFFERADVVYADGMSVVTIARLHGAAFTREHRITSLDFAERLFQRAAAEGWRVFYLGSAPGVIARGIAAFERMAPGLEIRFRHGYFDDRAGSSESEALCEAINDYDPDLLIVGMGMPRQEQWISRSRHRLSARVLMPIGALADYHAGAIPTPPRWAGRLGLEWAFRLMAEPKRLGRRYLVEPFRLVGPMMRSLRTASRVK